MSKSIVSNDQECFLCGTTNNLHRHHIFYGTANRKISEKEGCWCYLCSFHHNGSPVGVHFNKKLDEGLKQMCQILWEREHGENARELFIEKFGRSWR